MNRLGIALVVMIVVSSLNGCATYHEPGYNPVDMSHQSEGEYPEGQYRADSDRAAVTAQRQKEYDRHQDAVQRRLERQNGETRRQVQTGAGIIGGIAAGAALIHHYNR